MSYAAIMILLSILLLLNFTTLIYFINKSKKQRLLINKQEDEIIKLRCNSLSSRENQLLRMILKQSNEQDSMGQACMGIVKALLEFEAFHIEFCTLLLTDARGKYNIIATNIRDPHDRKRVEDFTNGQLMKMRKKLNNGGIVYSSEDFPLEYSFAKERGIRYYFLVPLEIGQSLIGAIVIENFFPNHQLQFEEEFFYIAVDNITVVLQNLLYRQKILAMALTDGLTGAYNRNYILQFLVEEIEQHRERREPCSLAILDIDYFKKLNDTYGHTFGDHVLKEVVKFLKKNTRKEDIVIRYGGEEFILYFPKISNQEIMNRVEELRIGLEKALMSMKTGEKMITTHITASFGLAEYPTDGKRIEELIDNADKALYYSKRNGRNQVNLYSKISNYSEQTRQMRKGFK